MRVALKETTMNASLESTSIVDHSLYLRVRLGFLQQETTLSRWCRENELTRQYVEKCLKFQRNGIAAHRLRNRVVEAAGVVS